MIFLLSKNLIKFSVLSSVDFLKFKPSTLLYSIKFTLQGEILQNAANLLAESKSSFTPLNKIYS